MGFVYLKDGTRVHTSELKWNNDSSVGVYNVPIRERNPITVKRDFEFIIRCDLRERMLERIHYLKQASFFANCPMDFRVE